jgi:hypothetical protein
MANDITKQIQYKTKSEIKSQRYSLDTFTYRESTFSKDDVNIDFMKRIREDAD